MAAPCYVMKVGIIQLIEGLRATSLTFLQDRLKVASCNIFDNDVHRAEEAETEQAFRVMTTVSPLVTCSKGPVRGEVDGVLFCHDLTKLSLCV